MKEEDANTENYLQWLKGEDQDGSRADLPDPMENPVMEKKDNLKKQTCPMKTESVLSEKNLFGQVHSLIWDASRIFITPLGRHKGMPRFLARAPKTKKGNRFTHFEAQDFITFDTIQVEKGQEAVNLVKVQAKKKEEEKKPVPQEPVKRAKMAAETSNASEASDTSSDGNEQKKRRKASPIRESVSPLKPRGEGGNGEMNGIRIRVEKMVIGEQRRKETTVKKTAVKEEQEDKSSTRR